MKRRPNLSAQIVAVAEMTNTTGGCCTCRWKRKQIFELYVGSVVGLQVLFVVTNMWAEMFSSLV